MQSGGRYTVLQGMLGLYYVVVVGQTVVAVNHSVCRDKWDVSDGWLVFWGHIAPGLVHPHFLLLSHTVLPGMGHIKVQSGWNTAGKPSGCFVLGFFFFFFLLFAFGLFPRDKQQPTDRPLIGNSCDIVFQTPTPTPRKRRTSSGREAAHPLDTVMSHR